MARARDCFIAPLLHGIVVVEAAAAAGASFDRNGENLPLVVAAALNDSLVRFPAAIPRCCCWRRREAQLRPSERDLNQRANAMTSRSVRGKSRLKSPRMYAEFCMAAECARELFPAPDAAVKSCPELTESSDKIQSDSSWPALGQAPRRTRNSR